MLVLVLINSVAAMQLSSWPKQPKTPHSAPFVRYFYEGGTLKRDGRLIPLVGAMNGEAVLSLLESDGADIKRFDPRVYDSALRGWLPLNRETEFESDDSTHVDVQLCRRRAEEEATAQHQADGFFSIGI